MKYLKKIFIGTLHWRAQDFPEGGAHGGGVGRGGIYIPVPGTCYRKSPTPDDFSIHQQQDVDATGTALEKKKGCSPQH